MERLGVKMSEKGIKESDTKHWIIREERAQEIGLVPRSSLIYPGFRILEPITDVVEVDEYAGAYAWQYLEYQMVDITAGL